MARFDPMPVLNTVFRVAADLFSFFFLFLRPRGRLVAERCSHRMRGCQGMSQLRTALAQNDKRLDAKNKALEAA